MLGFLVGLAIGSAAGGLLGVALICILQVGAEEDRQMERLMEERCDKRMHG